MPGQAFQPGALYDENLALRAHVKALEFEVASLIAQRDATRAWLGDTVVARSPLAEHTNPTTVEEKARQLAQQYPEQKIMAIKDLRAWSHHPDRGNMTSLGLREAKDAMDRAYAEINRTELNRTGQRSSPSSQVQARPIPLSQWGIDGITEEELGRLNAATRDE